MGATIISEDQAKQKKFDFCFILTPATNRLEYLKMFKNNSKNFFLEKPISNDYNLTKKYFSTLDKKTQKKLENREYFILDFVFFLNSPSHIYIYTYTNSCT